MSVLVKASVCGWYDSFKRLETLGSVRFNGGVCSRLHHPLPVQEDPGPAPFPAHPPEGPGRPVREGRVQETQERSSRGGEELHDGVGGK